VRRFAGSFDLRKTPSKNVLRSAAELLQTFYLRAAHSSVFLPENSSPHSKFETLRNQAQDGVFRAA
jgi:hypothetical protein